MPAPTPNESGRNKGEAGCVNEKRSVLVLIMTAFLNKISLAWTSQRQGWHTNGFRTERWFGAADAFPLWLELGVLLNYCWITKRRDIRDSWSFFFFYSPFMMITNCISRHWSIFVPSAFTILQYFCTWRLHHFVRNTGKKNHGRINLREKWDRFFERNDMISYRIRS